MNNVYSVLASNLSPTKATNNSHFHESCACHSRCVDYDFAHKGYELDSFDEVYFVWNFYDAKMICHFNISNQFIYIHLRLRETNCICYYANEFIIIQLNLSQVNATCSIPTQYHNSTHCPIQICTIHSVAGNLIHIYIHIYIYTYILTTEILNVLSNRMCYYLGPYGWLDGLMIWGLGPYLLLIFFVVVKDHPQTLCISHIWCLSSLFMGQRAHISEFSDQFEIIWAFDV